LRDPATQIFQCLILELDGERADLGGVGNRGGHLNLLSSFADQASFARRQLPPCACLAAAPVEARVVAREPHGRDCDRPPSS
jgi:hypothetical protein